MKINELPNNVIYIENALPKAAEFLERIEATDRNSDIYRVIPPWETWRDGSPLHVGDNQWVQVISDTDDQWRGDVKSFDWDLTENSENNVWPRVAVESNFSKAHMLADEIINLIEPDYIQALQVWADLTNNTMPEYITRNYCLRRYRPGAAMGVHIDRNTDNPDNTMDWTALLYLNDDYEGGEIYFPGTDTRLSPSAGSIVFLPCLLEHSCLEITEGHKYYIFTFMHTDYNTTTALGEPYLALNEAITEFRATT